MKWVNYSLLIIYGLAAFYFLYIAAQGLFVYFANKSLGHNESFFMPGRNLVIGIFLAAFTWLAWQFISQNNMSKIWSVLLYLPVIVVGLFFLFMLITLLSSGGKWN